METIINTLFIWLLLGLIPFSLLIIALHEE